MVGKKYGENIIIQSDKYKESCEDDPLNTNEPTSLEHLKRLVEKGKPRLKLNKL